MRLFNQITLLTPESVELEFVLAGLGSRALALLIDYQILGVGLLLFWIVWGMASAQLLSYLESWRLNSSGLPIWLLAIALLLSFVVYVGYFAAYELAWQGQTPGKRLAKIRVIRDDGRPVGLSQAVLRSLLRSIDDFMFIGMGFILLGRREKRIGDWVAGTIVIQENRPAAMAIALSEPDPQLADALRQAANLAELRPDEFAVIREYLQRRNRMDAKARSALSLQLARQTRAIVQLQSIPPDLTSDQFLEAVYLAYQEQVSGRF